METNKCAQSSLDIGESSPLPPSHSLHSLPLPLCVQSRKPMSEVVIRYVFLTLIHSVVCLHSMLDPHHNWKHLFITDQMDPELDPNVGVAPIPEGVIPFSVAVLTQHAIPLHYRHCPVEYETLQLELLHMIGAILSSSEVSVCVTVRGLLSATSCAVCVQTVL